MILTQKRKIKNFIATIIAYTLSIIILSIAILILIKIASLVAMILTYENVRTGILIISLITMLIMIILELRKE